MALAPRPVWEPLPEPPGPDPALAQEFQLLAAEALGEHDSLDVSLQSGIVNLESEIPPAELALDVLGLDLAAGAVELGGMQLEAAADTLAPELTQAAEQDAAILDAANEAAGEAGEPPARATAVSSPTLQGFPTSPL